MMKDVKIRFLGEVYTKHMFPFPGAERMSEEERDTLEMMVDPADSVRINIRFFLMIPIANAIEISPYLNSNILLETIVVFFYIYFMIFVMIFFSSSSLMKSIPSTTTKLLMSQKILCNK